MRVQSFDRFDVVGAFDEGGGAIATYRMDEMPTALRSEPTRGRFGFLSGLLVCLYRAEDGLWLRIGGRAARLADDVKPTWSPSDPLVTLALLDGPDVLAKVDYAPGPEWGPPLSDDPTPFVEAEDWDFGLWIVNIATTPERAARMFID